MKSSDNDTIFFDCFDNANCRTDTEFQMALATLPLQHSCDNGTVAAPHVDYLIDQLVVPRSTSADYSVLSGDNRRCHRMCIACPTDLIGDGQNVNHVAL